MLSRKFSLDTGLRDHLRQQHSLRLSLQVKLSAPPLLHGTLREYQVIGLDWLAKLYRKNLNGILADDAGLGKTVQIIAFFAHLACNEGRRMGTAGAAEPGVRARVWLSEGLSGVFSHGGGGASRLISLGRRVGEIFPSLSFPPLARCGSISNRCYGLVCVILII